MLAQRLTTQTIAYAQAKLRENLEQIGRCLKLLTEEQIWNRPNEVSNSIGVLVVHLEGNVRQWIGHGLGGLQDNRDRPAEFARRKPLPTMSLLSQIAATVDEAQAILERLSSRKLADDTKIQGYRVSGIAAVFHVVEHFSFHTGQIIYATKLITNQDLSLYDAEGRRLDGREMV